MNLSKWTKIQKVTKTLDIKINNLYFSGLILLIFLVNLAYSQPYFQDFPDDGTREVAGAVGVYQEHMLKSVDYKFNYSTPGFIRKSVTNERLYNQYDGKHVIVGTYSYKWLEGPQFETGNDLHFCIMTNNKAFFTVQMEKGLIAFTRDGRFRIDGSGRLVTLSGNYPVIGENGFIVTSKKGHYTITRHGGFYVDEEFIDTFKITQFKTFEDMNVHLHNINGSFFVLTGKIATIDDKRNYNILQGFIRQSNSFEAHDSWYYKNAHQATVNSIYKLINMRRTLVNAMN